MENVIIIGAGQAGLGVSYYLKRSGVGHIVLERSRIGESWRSQRWDSFSFNTPNAMTVMPGCNYTGAEADGFMSHQAFVDVLETFAEAHRLPVLAYSPVISLSASFNSGLYEVGTHERMIEARCVVIASGSQNCPKVPTLASSLPGEATQMHAVAYRAASLLPTGAVLVVGSGSSGGQIAEDLIEAGRTVFLATSRVPSFPRRYRGRDIITWFNETGRLAERRETLTPSAALAPQPLLSGVQGGHTLTLRSLRHRGAVLLGRLVSVDRGRLQFDASLADNLAFGDATLAGAKQNVDAYISSRGLSAPPAEPDTAEMYKTNLRGDDPGESTIDMISAGISTVIWCTGFRTDFGWIHLPIFDAAKQPKHFRGITECRGVYITGLQWLSSRRSGLVAGVQNDAQHIASDIVETLSCER
jgi:putative flavoprotein involved in K+ transport